MDQVVDRKLISIVAPFFNEEEGAAIFDLELRSVIRSLEYSYDFEFIYVDDGSSDRTRDVLQVLASASDNTRVISFTRNFGHQIAISAGVAESRGAAVVTLDSDLQDPPSLIPSLLEAWEAGALVVNAVRSSRDGETRFKLYSAEIFYRLINRVSDVTVPRQVGDYRLIDREVAHVLSKLHEPDRFVRGLISWTGYTQVNVEYQRDPRRYGTTKYPLSKMVKLAIDGILSLSSKPLSLLSAALVVLSGALLFASILIIILSSTRPSDVQAGWTSLITLGLIGMALISVSIAVLAAYLARIYRAILKRPLYLKSESKSPL